MKLKLDLKLFLIEALTSNKKIEKDIIKLYEKYKYKAYKLAKESELYNHIIIYDGSIHKEVFGKRVLGILLLSEKDEKIEDELLNIIKKGWLKLYNYIFNKEKISLYNIMKKFYNNSLSDDEVNALITISLMLSKILDKGIIQDEFYLHTIKTFYMRLKHYSNDEEFKNKIKIARFNYNTLDDKIKQKAKNIKLRIFEKYGQIKYPWNIFNINDKELRKYVEGLSFIFDTEELIYTSIIEKLKISQKEIEEICALYFMLYRNQNLIESTKFLITGIILKMSLKAFKEVKDYYFKNNKETLYIELEELENKIKYCEKDNNRLKEENNILKNEIYKLKNEYKKGLEIEIIKLKKEISNLKQELQEQKENEKELFALRETLFEIGKRNEVVEYEVIEENVKIPNVKAIIIGGHENWRRKLQEELPNTFRFIDGNKENFNIQILNDVDYIFFYTAYMSHGTYYKVINYCKKNNIEIGYISNTSIDLAKHEIANKINNY